MEMVVGAFLVMIFLGLGYFTIILSRETWFGTKHRLEAVFHDVRGLRVGDNVIVRGMPVGKITDLGLMNDGVHVMATLDEDIELREGYQIRVVTTSMLGGQHLEVREGPLDATPMPRTIVYTGAESPDLMADAAEEINALKVGVVEGGVIENLRETSTQFRQVAERINAGEGSLGRLLSSDDTLYRDVVGTMAALRSVVETLERGESTIGRLLVDDATVYEDLADTLTAVKDVAVRLEKGEGTLGQLLSPDAELYHNLQDATANIRDASAKLNEGNGLLGQMLNDEELYAQIKGLIGEVSAAVDDFRETSPITTFTSIFFGAF